MSYFNVPSQRTPAEHNAPNASPFFCNGHSTPVLEQDDIPLDSLAQFYIIAQPLFRFLRGCALIGTDQHHDSFLIHADSWFCIPTRDLHEFLSHDAFTEQPSFAAENGTPSYPASWLVPVTDLDQFLRRHVLPTDELPSSDNGHEIPTEQNDTLLDSTFFLISAQSLFEFLQPHEIPPVPCSFDKTSETPVVQQLEDGSESDLTSRSVTPTQSDSEGQVDAQLDGATAPMLHGCPLCEDTFSRVQERNRHLESYLPHSVHCPFQSCTWTGRRQYDFKGHWTRKHPVDQVPGEDATEIYDPKDFVKSILDGTPVEEVARSAFAKVQESLRGLGKPDVVASVFGRNRDLKKWIRILSSEPN